MDKNWRVGIEHIYSELKKIFEEYGMVELGKIGEAFDPSLHHSIGTVHVSDQSKDHQVAEVVQKGYKLGERVIRPAQVKIYEFQDGE